MAELGKLNKLTVVRLSSPGVYLDGGAHGEILLPNRYVPQRISIGDQLGVFVYRDSLDRLVATTETPRAVVGEVAALKVISVDARAGAFLDWGLAKDLLLPFREQTRPVRAGQEVMVRIYLDPKSDRIVATMRLDRDSGFELPDYRTGELVDIVIVDKTPLGYQALVAGVHSGLLYHENLPNPLRIGQALKAYVRTVRPDGKIDLSLDQSGYRRIAPLALKIIQALQKNEGRLELDDDSPPEAIRRHFGVSKKAFKQALGKLYKTRHIRFAKPGIELLDNSSWQPGKKH